MALELYRSKRDYQDSARTASQGRQAHGEAFVGHEVTMAADGMAGVTRVLEDRPDLALIDVGLPLMNGYQVARAIRQSVPAGALRLIAVTGYGQLSDKELALEAGFDAHVLKPVAPEILQKLLVS